MEPRSTRKPNPILGLAGLRVAITRARDEANIPSRFMQEMGAEVVYYPCFEIRPPEHVEELDKVLRLAAEDQFDWIALTTASTVLVIAERLAAIGADPDRLSGMKVAALGANTRLAAKEFLSVDVEMIPETTCVEDLVAALPPLYGASLLLPEPSSATPQLAELLTKRGAKVSEVTAYHPAVGHGGDEVPVMLWEGNIDAITFTSEANVRFFVKRLQYEGGMLSMLDDVCIACIEPMTANAALEYGLQVDVVPTEHTPRGLASALTGHFQFI